jgi:hypothetical protein
VKVDEKRLLRVFGRLGEEQQDRLIAFAEFLAAAAPGGSGVAGPATAPRPAAESVTLAIRRLVRTYPMLDRRRLMGDASRFLAQHALDGRPAAEVIDELEAVFAAHFQRMRDE